MMKFFAIFLGLLLIGCTEESEQLQTCQRGIAMFHLVERVSAEKVEESSTEINFAYVVASKGERRFLEASCVFKGDVLKQICVSSDFGCLDADANPELFNKIME